MSATKPVAILNELADDDTPPGTLPIWIVIVDHSFAFTLEEGKGRRYALRVWVPLKATNEVIKQHTAIRVSEVLNILHHIEGIKEPFIGWALFAFRDCEFSAELTKHASNVLESIRVERIGEFERLGLSFDMGPMMVDREGVASRTRHLKAQAEGSK